MSTSTTTTARMPRRVLAAVVLGIAFSACTPEGIQPPLEHIGRRATPLHFGLQVSPDPENNPIDPPERFGGYHVAVDYEVGTDELDSDVPVFAICTGIIAYSGYAEGYGGLVVQRCTINRSAVTVIYGHLAVAGLPPEGKRWRAGKQLGVLGSARSHDSGMNRKHLHLGIHKGKKLDLRGYVQTEEEVAEFIDPATVIPTGVAEELLPEIMPYWQEEAV